MITNYQSTKSTSIKKTINNNQNEHDSTVNKQLSDDKCDNINKLNINQKMIIKNETDHNPNDNMIEDINSSNNINNNDDDKKDVHSDTLKEHDMRFILKRNKRTGNYSILRKIRTNGHDTVQRVCYTIYGAYIPFGKEEYNNKMILNVIIYDSNNLNYNLIVTLNRIVNTFKELKNLKNSSYKYLLNDKTFFSFIKEVNDNDVNVNGKKYSLRLYFKYGSKISHAKYVGELTCDQLKGKRCNINIELGSLWINESTSMYGVNVHITHITIL